MKYFWVLIIIFAFLGTTVSAKLFSFCSDIHNTLYKNDSNLHGKETSCHSDSKKKKESYCFKCNCYLISIYSLNYFNVLQASDKSSNFNSFNTYYSSLDDKTKHPPPRFCS